MNRLRQLAPILIAIVVALLVVVLGFSLNPTTGISLLVTLLAVFLIWQWRYRKRAASIRKLSTQLRRVLSGDYHLDLQDYEEGELAVLSADIYKLVTAFREQASALQKDRTWLADSISDISHQLKTPITSMMMLTDLLKKDLDDNRRRQFLQQLSGQTDRLQWLVKNLLTLSKLDAHAIVYRPETISLHDIITQAAQPLLIGMELKNQNLEITGAVTENLVVDGDWLAEAVTNILKNANEHAPIDSTIQVEALDLPMSKAIAVHNQGTIAPVDLPNIFTRFYRGRQAAKDSIGIGLAIAKAIVTQQGGQIEVQSSDDKTSFVIRFPK